MAASPDPARLCAAINKDRLALRIYRSNRLAMVRQYVGGNWSEDGNDKKVPVNLIGLYISIMSRSLVAKNPRVLLSTFDRSQKPAVTAVNTWANKEIERMSLADTLQRCVIDGLFSMGLCKVALATPADAAAAGWGLTAGKPYAERVDLDDMVLDMHSRDFASLGYIGHRVRLPLDAIKDSKIYSKARKDLQASEDAYFNQQGDERINVMGRGYYSNQEEFEDMVDLWEIYLPRHKLIYVFADSQTNGPTLDKEPLRVMRWVGPEAGPYIPLPFSPVPGNLMPKGPIMDLVDLHEAANNAYRKLFRTIHRLKEVTLVSGGRTEDAERLMKLNDGDFGTCDDPDKVTQLTLSGNTLQTLVLVATELRNLFSWMAGNLEILGGLSPQSKTATQDKMLNENSGATISALQETTVKFSAEVLKRLTWYWWHDPMAVHVAEHAAEGAPEISIPIAVHPNQQGGPVNRSGPMPEINVDPYSLQHSTPQSRFAALNQVVMQIMTPLMPLMKEQGMTLDMGNYLKFAGQYLDMPDLEDLVNISEPQQVQPTGGEEAPPMPAQTERTYNRVSMPGRTQQGNDMNLKSALMGVDPGGAHTNGVMK